PSAFAYYRAAGGMIVPTMFSPASTPKIAEMIRVGWMELARQVSEELTYLAISMVGGKLISVFINRIIRWSLKPRGQTIADPPLTRSGEQPKTAPTSRPKKSVEPEGQAGGPKSTTGEAPKKTGAADDPDAARVRIVGPNSRLYDSVKLDKQQGSWTFTDEFSGAAVRSEIKTTITFKAPDGKIHEGWVIRRVRVKVNPTTQEKQVILTMGQADVSGIPREYRWIKEGKVDMVPGKIGRAHV